MRESERVKLARSLHDGIAQDLVGLSYRLQSLLANESSPPELRGEIRSAIFEVDELSRKVRDEIFALRDFPEEIYSADLARAISSIPAEITVVFHSHISIDQPIQSQLQEITLELVRNALTHAGATRIEITVDSFEDFLRCVVTDDGSGAIAVRDGHYGLLGIDELLATINGEINIVQEGPRRITLTLPLLQS